MLGEKGKKKVVNYVQVRLNIYFFYSITTMQPQKELFPNRDCDSVFNMLSHNAVMSADYVKWNYLYQRL